METLSPDQTLAIDIQQVSTHPCPTSVVVSRSPVMFRRSWQDIRRDAADFAVVRLIRSGSTKIAHCGRSIVNGPGDLIVTRSSLPMNLINEPGPDTPHETLFLKLPTALFERYASLNACLNLTLPSSSPHHRAVRELLEFLAARGEGLTREAADLILAGLFAELRSLLVEVGEGSECNITIHQARLQQVRTYIGMHFGDPQLSLDKVARSCGISPRYVSYLLAMNDSSYYQEIRDARLRAARDLLAAKTAANRVSIGQISQMTGFKTSAHFSHLFKQHFGCTPKEYRSGQISQLALAVPSQSAALHSVEN